MTKMPMVLVTLLGVACVLIGVLLVWTSAADDIQVAEGAEFSGKVTFVVDGDTFHMSGVKPSIRVWGMNTPEAGEKGYKAARNALSRMVNKNVLTCQKMDTDRYGRTVGRCTLQDGRDIAAEMIRGGFAIEYCRYSKGYYGTC